MNEELKRICNILNINLNQRSLQRHISARRHVLVWFLRKKFSVEDVSQATGYIETSVYKIVSHVEDLLSVKDKEIIFLIRKIEQNK